LFYLSVVNQLRGAAILLAPIERAGRGLIALALWPY
jgi:hypothetical protein